jgi:hypothetical protein
LHELGIHSRNLFAPKGNAESELGELLMCDYSLHHVASRPAKVKDKLFTTEFARSSTRGFAAAVGEYGAKLVIHDGPPKVAVCLLPAAPISLSRANSLNSFCAYNFSAK